ncbi:MAG: glycosyltransferase family 4 protein [Acidobacteria bacterium]|nr:MAG: glycosyltransferase family 4 protein [Acidobacteriota bacterium]
MKVALIHDWLTGMRGGEKVLESLCELFPDAPIFTLIHVPGSVSAKIESHPIHTSFLQRIPMIKKQYRNYLPLFPSAIESFDLQDYDFILSSSHCVAKGIIPAPATKHLCYCHTPMRYIWSHYYDYFGDHRLGFVKRKTVSFVANYLRLWDIASNNRVDHFVANSQFVAGRMKRYYGKESSVIYPPVDVDFYEPSDRPPDDFYLIVSALVPYKRLELAIQAFNKMKKQLIIVGTGPDGVKLRRLAYSGIKFLGHVTAEKLRELYQSAKGLIQPGVEDFGINIVEALASGCPIIAYHEGGATETVRDQETGLFFNHFDVEELCHTIDKFERMRFNKPLMREGALRFSPGRFQSELKLLIQQKFFDA